jgi:hypothetical protein
MRMAEAVILSWPGCTSSSSEEQPCECVLACVALFHDHEDGRGCRGWGAWAWSEWQGGSAWQHVKASRYLEHCLLAAWLHRQMHRHAFSSVMQSISGGIACSPCQGQGRRYLEHLDEGHTEVQVCRIAAPQRPGEQEADWQNTAARRNKNARSAVPQRGCRARGLGNGHGPTISALDQRTHLR